MMRKLISVILALALTISFIPVSPATVAMAAATINIGDYVQMGSYYDEPILWRCVDIDENGPLMLADRILTIKPFDVAGNHKYLDGTEQTDESGGRTSYGSNLWQTSNMRCWLNSTATAGNVTWIDGCPPTADKVYNDNGYNAYASEKGFLAVENFSAEDRSAMKSVNQKSLLNEMDASKLRLGGNTYHAFSPDISTIVQNYDTAYYHDVTDKMFLLDVKQVNKVYQNSITLGTNYYIGKPTQKAVDNSEYKDSYLNVTSNWVCWLRSPCANSDYGGGTLVRYVDSWGYVYNGFVSGSTVGVRPAFYLDIQSAIFKSGNGLVGSPYSLDVLISSVKLSKTTAPIKIPLTLQLSATVLPTNASNKSIKWVSSNIKIATVSSIGKVTAKAPGSAIITAKTVDGGFKAICKVTVTQPVTSVMLNKSSLSIHKYKTFKLIPTINPSNATNKKVTWKSSNKAIATVSSTGTVKGIKKGSCYITVVTVDGKKSAKCKVVVK